MKNVFLALSTLAFVLGLNLSSAQALPQFKKAFEGKYPSMKDTIKNSQCNVCHIKGEEKEKQNAYGAELNKLIEGDAKHRIDDAKEKGEEAKKAEETEILKELEDAFKKVEDMESPGGGKYGDRFKEGKHPVDN